MVLGSVVVKLPADDDVATTGPADSGRVHFQVASSTLDTAAVNVALRTQRGRVRRDREPATTGGRSGCGGGGDGSVARGSVDGTGAPRAGVAAEVGAGFGASVGAGPGCGSAGAGPGTGTSGASSGVTTVAGSPVLGSYLDSAGDWRHASPSRVRTPTVSPSRSL